MRATTGKPLRRLLPRFLCGACGERIRTNDLVVWQYTSPGENPSLRAAYLRAKAAGDRYAFTHAECYW